MRALGSSVLVLLLAVLVAPAWADEDSFGAPAMLPLPTTLAPPGASPYLAGQPAYPPGLIAAPPAYPPGLISGQPVYAQPQPAYVPVYVQPQSHLPNQPAYAYPRPMPRTQPSSRVTARTRYDYAAKSVAQPPPNANPNAGLANQPSIESPGCPGGNCFDEAIGSPCGACGGCAPCCRPTWFGEIGGMVLTRNNANPTWTSALVSNNSDQVMNTVERPWRLERRGRSSLRAPALLRAGLGCYLVDHRAVDRVCVGARSGQLADTD